MAAAGRADGTQTPAIRTKVLELIAAQLQAYGYYQLASILQEETGISETLNPASTIEETLFADEKIAEDVPVADSEAVRPKPEDEEMMGIDPALFEGNPVAATIDDDSQESEAPRMIAYYNTTHRGPSLVASFSLDGRFLASGSTDMSIKVIDVEKVKTAYETSSDMGRPVIRTLYDHSATINDVQFHPNGTVVVSASDDGHIKIFDVLKVNSKKSFRYIQDVTQIKTLSFHPSGDFLAVGTLHPVLRIYDVHTLKSYAVPDRGTNHTGPVLKVQYSSNGRMIVSGGGDGTVKIWDAVAGKCVRTLESPHNGQPVTSVCLSTDGRELLTTGGDAVSRLWDLAGSAACTMEYLPSSGSSTDGVSAAMLTTSGRDAQFTFDGRFVAGTDAATGTLALWNKRTGKLNRCFADGDAAPTWVAASPRELAVATCSDDAKVRYWGVA